MAVLKAFSLADTYRGASAFLVCCGPSLKSQPTKRLLERGILSMGINNVSSVVKTNMWICGDTPGHFCDTIFKDPSIQKFIPEGRLHERFRVRNAKKELVSGGKVSMVPHVFSYPVGEYFCPATFISEKVCTWGNADNVTGKDGHRGGRSTMLSAIKMLYVLGIRKIYLLGADFSMTGKDAYAFPQGKDEKSKAHSNKLFKILNERFPMLLPYFKDAGLEIFNCTPNSHLTSFPSMSFEDALIEMKRKLPLYVDTAGMYNTVKPEYSRKIPAPNRGGGLVGHPPNIPFGVEDTRVANKAQKVKKFSRK